MLLPVLLGTLMGTLLGTLSGMPPLAGAQSAVSIKTPARPSTDSVSAALLDLEEQWAVGVTKRDGALFDRLLAPGFVYTEDQTLMTRTEVIASITTGGDTVTTARNDGMVVHRYGTLTAVVTGWLTLGGHGPAGKFNRKYRFTDTWTKLGSHWQIVAAQDYLIPSAVKR
jgi:hypothetical protein